LFALYDGDLKTISVVTNEDDKTYEIKNIATYEKYQGKGYGKIMIQYIIEYYKHKCTILFVGTGESNRIISFYEKCGFVYSHTEKDFFVKNYDHKIFDEGKQLKDMIYLKMVFEENMNIIDTDFNEKLEKQLLFIVEIDKIKNIFRKTRLFDHSRYENDAEHSWTISVMALLLKEYSNVAINMEKVISMLLIHDIVEIDAGDTFLYSDERKTIHIDEEKAAERIFGLLDKDQKEYFMNIWNEFEERKTNEAKYAAVFDRLEPLLQNYILEGKTRKKHNVTYEMVIEKNKHIQEASDVIWEFVLKLLEKAVEKGYLKREQTNT
jgi:putative hydrolase of HD superfamily